MRNPLRRYFGQGELHFITFSCFRRLPLLGAPMARDCFVQILDEVRSRHGAKLIGYVVMPEHVHLLISEPVKGDPSKVLQVLKQKVSSALRDVRVQRSPNGSRGAPVRSSSHAPAFWQRRYYDFNVWNESKAHEKLDYMHQNPIARKLAERLEDWPWSSWSYYAKGEEGLIRIDSVEEFKIWELQKLGGRSQKPHP